MDPCITILQSDSRPARETLITAAEQMEAVLPEGDGRQEVVGDKGYHSNQSLVDLEAMGVRSYISAADRGRRTGNGNRRGALRSIAIGDAFVAPAACVCCGSRHMSHGSHVARSRGPRSNTSGCENWFSPRAARTRVSAEIATVVGLRNSQNSRAFSESSRFL